MPNYFQFIEQTHITGPMTRPDQRTFPVAAEAEDQALKKAAGLIGNVVNR